MRTLVSAALIGCHGGASDSATGVSSPSDSAPVTDTGADPAQLCVDTINLYRGTLHLAPYARWTGNEPCVDQQAREDAKSGVAHSAFGECGEWAQNECPDWPAPPGSMIEDCLAMMWAEGPGADFSVHGHYLNMSNPDYTQVACGYHVGNDGTLWATQDFK